MALEIGHDKVGAFHEVLKALEFGMICKNDVELAVEAIESGSVDFYLYRTKHVAEDYGESVEGIYKTILYAVIERLEAIREAREAEREGLSDAELADD